MPASGEVILIPQLTDGEVEAQRRKPLALSLTTLSVMACEEVAPAQGLLALTLFPPSSSTCCPPPSGLYLISEVENPAFSLTGKCRAFLESCIGLHGESSQQEGPWGHLLYHRQGPGAAL